MKYSLRFKLIPCFAATLSLALLLGQALGWGAGGHMMVAQIAYSRLNPKAKAEADRLIAIEIEPAAITKNSLDFVNASHWPDDLRPVPQFANTLPQHFVDIPFSAGGAPLPHDLPEASNIITALK